MRLLPVLVAASLLAGTALAAPPPVAPPAATPAATATPMPAGSPFTPEQRAAVVDIMREALRSDPSILRDAIGAVQADDTAHQQAVARTAIAQSRDALLATPGDPVAGNKAGDVTLVEFYDTRCPYCRRIVPTLAALLQQDHGIRLIYKDLPILGPSSQVEARALLAAERQGGYVPLQSVLMQSTGDATPATVRAAAAKAGLDGERLLRDMQDPAIQQRIDANLALARKLGVEGTPALVIGNTMVPGAVELAELQQAVAAARKGG